MLSCPRVSRTNNASPATLTKAERHGRVYIGNRADANVCALDATTLARGGCLTIPSSPDGIAYVAKTHEVWVTTPRDKSI